MAVELVLRGSGCSQQAPGTQPPQPQWERFVASSGVVFTQPGACHLHVADPALPAGAFKIARTVTAALQVNLQHGKACLRQCARPQSRHVARLVHLFSQGVKVQTQPAHRPVVCRVVQTKTAAIRLLQKERVRRLRHGASMGQLKGDEITQRTDSLKDLATDFIVVQHNVKLLF